MTRKYALLEHYLRNMLSSEGEVTLTFDRIEQILKAHLPLFALQDRTWWRDHKQATPAEAIGGWIVDVVDLEHKWVRFVRQ